MTKVFEPVPLIRDLTPPEGRVTVELLDERGLKVLQRVKSDNAIMTHWNDTMKLQVRGQDGQNGTEGQSGYLFHGSDAFLASNTDADSAKALIGTQWYKALQLGQSVWGTVSTVRSHHRSIILTDSTQTVNAAEYMFPGELNAFCYMPEVYAPSTNLKRTQLTVASSYRTVSALHYVAEWGTGYGNGTHNSVGIGGVAWPAGINDAKVIQSMYPSQGLTTAVNRDTIFTSLPSAGAANQWHVNNASRTFIGAGTMAANTDIPNISGHRVSDSEWWILLSGTAGNNLIKIDNSTATVQPFSANSAAAGVSVTGPTMTTIGSTTSRTGVCAIGADLWLAYGTTLKRCAKPTNTTLSVTNTYAPVGVGTLVDLTTDGTDLYWLDATKVWVISATTGAVTSSWNHGLTGTMQNIAFGVQPNRLYISYIATGVTAALWNANSSNTRTPMYIGQFTTAGVASGTSGASPVNYASGSSLFLSGLIMPLDALNNHWLGYCSYNTTVSLMGLRVLGPSHASRTVLPSPVVKTSANSMRVIYEFGF